jgi:hypothetical protein
MRWAAHEDENDADMAHPFYFEQRVSFNVTVMAPFFLALGTICRWAYNNAWGTSEAMTGDGWLILAAIAFGISAGPIADMLYYIRGRVRLKLGVSGLGLCLLLWSGAHAADHVWLGQF